MQHNLKRHQTLKSILLLAGAFTFAFLLGEAVHELGHFLAHQINGSPDARIILNPFGASRITGVKDLSLEASAFTCAAGPLFNLALGLFWFLSLWRWRRPALLPLLMWGPVAMIQEGVTFSLGLLTPGGDAQWIAAYVVPEAVILTVGVLLLLAGLAAMGLLFPLAAIESKAPFWRNLFIVAAGMCSLMLVRAVYSIFTSPAAAMENLVPMVFSLLLAGIVVLLYKPVSALAHKTPALQYRAETPAVSISLFLGTVIFLLQIALLN